MSFLKKKSPLFIFMVILGSLIFLWFIKGPIVASYLSNKMKVDVSLLSVKLRPSYLKIHNFRIANPPRSKTAKAFSAKTIEANYSLEKLFGNPSVIEEVFLDKVFVGVEFYNPLGTDTNWGRIFNNMKAKEKKEEKEKGFIIRKLIIQDLDLSIYGLGVGGVLGKAQKKHFPKLVFYNINSKSGFPTGLILETIFNSLGIENYLKNLFNPEKELKGIFNIFNKQKSEIEEKKETLPKS